MKKILLGLAITVLFSSCEESEDTKNRRKAYISSQYCVKKELKDPNSAEFPKDYKYTKVNDTTWKIGCELFAKNSFGGTVRVKYVVTMTLENGEWVCSNLKML